MQHLMGRRATAQGVPVHCCIDLTRYEYRYNRGAAGKEAFFPGLPSGERYKGCQTTILFGLIVLYGGTSPQLRLGRFDNSVHKHAQDMADS